VAVPPFLQPLGIAVAAGRSERRIQRRRIDDFPARRIPLTVSTRAAEAARVLPGADVAGSAELGVGTTVWHLAQIRERAVLGRDCIVGRGAYVGSGVRIGNNCKLQNYALVYEPALLEDGVFVGPAAVFTNDQYPRAITADGRLKTASDWEPAGVTVRHGASIGARAVCVAPVTIGAWSLVAAGSVVIHDVPDFGLVVGTPARRVGWVGRAGVPLLASGEGAWRCPRTDELYLETDGVLAPAEPDVPPPPPTGRSDS